MHLRTFRIAVVTFALCCLTASAVSAVPLRFEQGKHYKVVANHKSRTPVLRSFFSFYCPHCYRFAAVVSKLGASLPKGVVLVRSHVHFMRFVPLATQKALSRTLVVARKLNVEERMVNAIFKVIHKDRKRISSEADIRAIFVANGIAGPTFDRLANASGVKSAADKMKERQDDLLRRRVLRGIPMLIVNDKYQLVAKHLRSLDEYENLIRFLLSLK